MHTMESAAMNQSSTVRVVAALGLVLVALAGCQSASHEARFELQVTEAVVEENAPEEGPTARELAAAIDWTMRTDGLDARVTNRADTVAMILWEGATFSVDGGETEPLVATAPQQEPEVPGLTSAIPAGGQMVVGMLPRSHAEWEWMPSRAMGGAWKPASGLFGVEFTTEQTEAERQALAETAVGRKVKVDVPVRIGSRVLRHIFDIRVTGAEVYASHH
jgi:hypothetical protein